MCLSAARHLASPVVHESPSRRAFCAAPRRWSETARPTRGWSCRGAVGDHPMNTVAARPSIPTLLLSPNQAPGMGRVPHTASCTKIRGNRKRTNLLLAPSRTVARSGVPLRPRPAAALGGCASPSRWSGVSGSGQRTRWGARCPSRPPIHDAHRARSRPTGREENGLALGCASGRGIARKLPPAAYDLARRNGCPQFRTRHAHKVGRGENCPKGSDQSP